MFNFTTQSVFNDIKVHNLSSGRTVPKDANLVVGDTNDVPSLRIGNTRFTAADIESIQIKDPSSEKLASVTFDMLDIIPASGTVDARIALYINLSMSSQDSFYANPFVYKGKPLYVEFYAKSTDTPDVVAKRVKANADKYLLFTAQEKILSVTATTDSTQGSEEGTVTFEGVNGYQIITKAAMQKYDPEAKTIDCCSKQGEYVDVKVGVPVIYKLVSDAIKTKDSNSKEYYLDEAGTEQEVTGDLVPIYPGLEAFGDYNWLIHNLRLPTAANTNFWAPTKNEMPAVGNVYTQFIVTIAKNRDGIAGEVVGQRATSVTTHVFYVAGNRSTSNTPAYKVYTQLNTLKSSAISTEADTALANPFNTSKSLTA